MKRLFSLSRTYCPVLLLAIFFSLSFFSLRNESVTVDEFAHLPAGYTYWQTGDFRLYYHNPPLVKLWAALPLQCMRLECKPPASFGRQAHWNYGRDFMYQHSRNYLQLFFWGRLMILLLGLAGGCLVFRWAKELNGYAAGCLALVWYCFSPELLAHSHLVTTDCGAAVFLLLALYTFSRFMQAGTWRSLWWAGLCLGLAQLVKFSALALYPIVISCFLFSYRSDQSRLRRLKQLLAMLVLSVVVINWGYLFSGTFSRVSSFHFQSRLFSALSGCLPSWLPLPFPVDYLTGMDAGTREIEQGHYTYFFGDVSTRSRWYYYLVAFVLKTPLAMLAGIIFWGVLQARKKIRPLTAGEWCILWAVVWWVIAVSLGRGNNIGIRYLLPVLPLLCVLLSRLWLWAAGRPLRKGILALLLLGYILEALSVAPHYLSFFNRLAGGPKQGYRYLVDSNIDWGQDLPALKKYMEAHGLMRIRLAYFGPVDPRLYGINYEVLGQTVQPQEAVAVSIHFYQGMPYRIMREASYEAVPPHYYSYLQQYPIKARIGYSMLIIER